MAGWSQVFYLVTCGEFTICTEGKKKRKCEKAEGRWLKYVLVLGTDILGPFNAPFAIASIGLVPGVLLYVRPSFASEKILCHKVP